MDRKTRVFNAFYLPNIDADVAERLSAAFIAGDQVEVGRIMCEHVDAEVAEGEARSHHRMLRMVGDIFGMKPAVAK